MRGYRAGNRRFRGMEATLSRRQFVRLGGAGLAGAALLGVAGCGGEESASATCMVLQKVGLRP
jgi:hypothetical protein